MRPMRARGNAPESYAGEQRGSGALELQSDLWLDQPDAHERIDERCARDLISPDEAAGLRAFADLGRYTLALDNPIHVR